MKLFRSLLCLSLATLLPQLPGQGGGKPDPLREVRALSKVVPGIVAQASPWVVTVETFGGIRRSTLGSPKKPRRPKKGLGPLRMPGFLQAQGTSTGIVVGSDGWILTTRFVLNFQPTTILVSLADGRKFTAKKMGEDQGRGIALLKVEADDLPVPEMVPGEEMRVGQWVFALGRSFGPKLPTVHAGILSSLGRIHGKAIQCDANTSPANYGGPLVDLRGRALAIIVPLSPNGDMAGANWYDSGIGFGVPLHGLGPILAELKKGRIFKRPLLGVRMDPNYLGPGGKILSVQKDSAAWQAGLAKGDLILAVGGKPARNGMHVQDLIGHHHKGDFVFLRFRKKDGTEGKVLVEL
ncbi:MAG TPA: PDZ domain-containing protein [Planctomycetes bacterium]|nr:PDZ domain-containing protein [Planctomycetota bacterium]